MAEAPIINSAETIGAAYAPSLNAAFQELHDRFLFWPIVKAPYGGLRTLADQNVINPGQKVSDHLKGRAVDIDNQRAFRNVNQTLFLSILASHGWRNVQVNGRPFTAEPWHFANQSASPAGGNITAIVNTAGAIVRFILNPRNAVAGQARYWVLTDAGVYPFSGTQAQASTTVAYLGLPATLTPTVDQFDALVRLNPPAAANVSLPAGFAEAVSASIISALGPQLATDADLNAAKNAIIAAIPTAFHA